MSDGVEIGQEPGDILTYNAPAPAPPPVSQPSVSYSNNNFSRRNVRVKEWGSFAIKDSEDDEIMPRVNK